MKYYFILLLSIRLSKTLYEHVLLVGQKYYWTYRESHIDQFIIFFRKK